MSESWNQSKEECSYVAEHAKVKLQPLIQRILYFKEALEELSSQERG
jgi:hypothetical protein